MLRNMIKAMFTAGSKIYVPRADIMPMLTPPMVGEILSRIASVTMKSKGAVTKTPV